ncbi:CapA family protein [Carnobacteriaceae bacterium zg-ZUI252]|nr:CapA family protein [Carnobacteriaceae bacterium zg-ZUI252]
MRREQGRLQKRKRQQKRKNIIHFSVVMVLAIIVAFLVSQLVDSSALSRPVQTNDNKVSNTNETNTPNQQVQKARIMASGDMLYHIPIYESALQSDGTYDFSNNYKQIKSLISSADLALGDFEGTINEDYQLGGYPLFNAPKEVVSAIKDAGYDMIDLAHNHILDSGLSGLKTTYQAFESAGLQPFGVSVDGSRDILIKEVNGIKIAILGYAYGFNGLEAQLTDAEYQTHLRDLNEAKIKEDLEKAEKLADITVVMPQMGIEYMLSPTSEQQRLYRQMIEWGADIIFGGHPHVMEPTEIIHKDGEQKFIIYSMGNLLSNQRVESMDDTANKEWTERGVIVEVSVEKANNQTKISDIVLHPTWVSRVAIPGKVRQNGLPAYDYQVVLGKNYLEDGEYVDSVDSETLERIRHAYHATLEFLNLQFKR